MSCIYVCVSNSGAHLLTSTSDGWYNSSVNKDSKEALLAFAEELKDIINDLEVLCGGR